MTNAAVFEESAERQMAMLCYAILELQRKVYTTSILPSEEGWSRLDRLINLTLPSFETTVPNLEGKRGLTRSLGP
jgi:adenosylcobinamide amidohydrolase